MFRYCCFLSALTQILRSLTYRNLHPDNRIIDGQRSIIITANDTFSYSSQQLTFSINVGDRNDAPVVNLGAGDEMDFMITFTENGSSIPIVLSHLVSIMDEENHNISRLTVELFSPNGVLNDTDAIFLRSPLALQFIEDFRIPPTTHLIDISLNATTATYRDALLSIFYVNEEDEPALFNATGDDLLRVIRITIYDDNFLPEGQSPNRSSNFDDNFGVGVSTIRVGVTIRPVNDHAPRILLRAEPDGCATFSSGTTAQIESLARQRRDVGYAIATRLKKRGKNSAVQDSKVKCSV